MHNNNILVQMADNSSKPIALVLSSGGARGVAQIGVIEELESHGFTIKAIAGSSMGALIGGLYAAGKLGVYKDWVCKMTRMDVFNLVDFTFSRQGFIRGDRVFNEMKKLIKDCNIEDLDIPFTAVASNLKTHREIIFSTGSLYTALRASMAVPTIITPSYETGDELVDGGILNPVPMDLVKRTDGDQLVVVNVNAMEAYHKPHMKKIGRDQSSKVYRNKLEELKGRWLSILPNQQTPPKKLSFFDLMNKSYDLMQDKLASIMIESYKPDLVINISNQSAGTFEYYKAKELIEVGREACRKTLSK